MIDKLDKNGNTQLMIYSAKGDIEKVNNLLSQGANPFLKDKHGMTARIRAENTGRKEIVNILEKAEKNFDPNRVNSLQNEPQIELTQNNIKLIKNIPVITSENITASRTIKVLGTARGSTVRAKHIGRDFMAEIKNIVGGELKGYTELLAEGREEAIFRMQIDAYNMGANCIICTRIATSTLTGGAAEILAYGTAITIEDVS